MSARTGYCPALPAPQLALARLADRIRTGLGQAGAVFRCHPAASSVPVVLVSAGAVAFLLLPAISGRGWHGPPPRQVAAVAPAPASAGGALPEGASAGGVSPGGASAGVPPLPGGLIPAGHAGPASDLLAPAPSASVGVAAFTSRNSTAP